MSKNSDKIVMKKIGEIKPYENNPRFNDDAVQYVANSIKEFGFKVPIVIDKKGVIVAGHTGLKAAEQLGMTEVPCIIADDISEELLGVVKSARDIILYNDSFKMKSYGLTAQNWNDKIKRNDNHDEANGQFTTDDGGGCSSSVEDEQEYEYSEDIPEGFSRKTLMILKKEYAQYNFQVRDIIFFQLKIMGDGIINECNNK